MIDGSHCTFTGMKLGIKELSYENRLLRQEQYSLECRRLKGDVIEVVKMIKGSDRPESEKLFPLVGRVDNQDVTLMLKLGRSGGLARKPFFTQTAEVWSSPRKYC